jgi:hypothetical protein
MDSNRNHVMCETKVWACGRMGAEVFSFWIREVLTG